MKILMVNRYGYPKYGTETCFLNLCRLLRERGHKVITFTTKDERNVDKEYADYYVNKIDIDNLNSMPLLNKISFAPKTIYSLEAKRKIERLIRDTKPDIVHIHSIKRLISPSILHSIKNFGLPVVYTLHNFHLICPNSIMFSKGKICEDCKGNRYYDTFLKRCVRNSPSLSLLACVEQYIHNMLRTFENNVDMFIAPSNFLRQKMIEFGFKPEKIIHIPYFIFTDDYQPKNGFSNYIVYCGRLVAEKGVLTLIKAVRNLPSGRLVILGEGEYRKELESLVNKERIDNVEFKGYMPQDAIKKVVKNAMFVVTPSLWHENSPMVIYESFAMAKPVIGADIGGIPEIIDDGVNGLLFRPADVGDLVKKIKYLLDNKDRFREMGENARRKALENYNQNIHYEKILKVYQNLITKR